MKTLTKSLLTMSLLRPVRKLSIVPMATSTLTTAFIGGTSSLIRTFNTCIKHPLWHGR